MKNLQTYDEHLNEMKKGELTELPENIQKLVQSIMQRLGYKMYEMDVKRAYNNYFIVLPYTSLKAKDLEKLLTVIGDEDYSLGVQMDISETLSIRLNKAIK